MGARDEKPNDEQRECKHLNTRIFQMETHDVNQYSRKHIRQSLLYTFAWYLRVSSIDMYNNDVGKKFMK